MVGLEDLLNKRCKNQFYDWFRGLTNIFFFDFMLIPTTLFYVNPNVMIDFMILCIIFYANPNYFVYDVDL